MNNELRAWAMSYELRATSYELRATELKIMNYKLQAMIYEIWDTSSELGDTRYKAAPAPADDNKVLWRSGELVMPPPLPWLKPPQPLLPPRPRWPPLADTTATCAGSAVLLSTVATCPSLAPCLLRQRSRILMIIFSQHDTQLRWQPLQEQVGEEHVPFLPPRAQLRHGGEERGRLPTA